MKTKNHSLLLNVRDRAKDCLLARSRDACQTARQGELKIKDGVS